MTTRINLNKPEKVLNALSLDSLQVTSCIDATTSDCGYTSGEIDGKPYSSELFFEYIIGGTSLEDELANTDPTAVHWPALYASRILSGIDPKHYGESDLHIKHARNHPAVAQAQKNADEILKHARHEKRNEMTPQEWLAWADNTSFIVYPPCRRLIQYWQHLIDQRLTNSELTPTLLAPPATEDGDDTTHDINRRQDLLGMELGDLLHERKTQNLSIKPSVIMSILIERAGKPNTCITKNVINGVEYSNYLEEDRPLTIRALGQRILRWKVLNP